jgi:hypothetical protein
MAVFNNGFPMNYPQMYYPQYPQQQFQQPQQMAQQPMQQPVQPQPAPQQVTNNLTWVQGEAGAKSHFVAPNTTVPLWDSEAQRIFLKSADAAGMPSMKILNYTIEETPNIGSPAQKAVNAAVNPVQAPPQEYAGKAETAALKAEIEAYKAEMESLRAELETFRGDLYGIAGKKPSTRKKEVAPDE